MSPQRRRRPSAPAVLFLVVAALLAATGASGQSLPRVAPEEVGLSGPRLDRVTAFLEEYAATERFAGAVVIVGRRGGVAYLHAAGARDREAGADLRHDDIFRIASQTKALVSLGILMLQEEGRLLITDPVSRFLPEYAEVRVAEPREGGYELVRARRQVNLRDLLTHTAGVSYGSGPARDQWERAGIGGWYFADRSEPIRETVARIATLPFDAHPGDRFVYGYSTDILGAVIEVASGMSLDQFLHTRIFAPLGMQDTHFYVPPEKADRLAAVYSATPAGLERAPNPGAMVGQGAYLSGPRTSFSGGAGLLSTAEDYGRFLQMMLNGGELDGVRIVSRKTVELMTTDHLREIGYRPGIGFGLGFSVLEDVGTRGTPGSVGEYGWGGAYHSTYWVDPSEEMFVVFLTQLIPAGASDAQAKLRALVYQAIVD